MRFRSLFSYIIYTLSVGNAIMISAFYYYLSLFDKKGQLEIMERVSFTVTWDLFVEGLMAVLLFAVFPAYVQYDRYGIASYVATKYGNALQAKLVTILLTDLGPFALLFIIFTKCVKGYIAL